MKETTRQVDPELKARAERGDSKAQFALGRELAEAAVPDLGGAARWFQRAADQGVAEAQYRLAVCYLNGQGVAQDPDKATLFLRKAAEQGHAGAQDSLGVRYATGQGVPQNDTEAVKWFRRAAEQGHPVGQFNLGLAYAQGRGVPLDLVEAYSWFCLSAELGDTVAAGAVETIVEALSIEDLRKARALFHKRFSTFGRTEAQRAA
ncbi:MAG TPA: hypothetical protein DCM86_10940 [Verrucomicrobiales bacterium]|nr:hypothetical protein [Verrucomicrobiales bacterium]